MGLNGREKRKIEKTTVTIQVKNNRLLGRIKFKTEEEILTSINK